MFFLRYKTCATMRRVLWKLSGWFVPLLYLVVISGAVALHFRHIVPKITVLWFERATMYVIVAANFASFILCATVSPGYARTEPLTAVRMFPYDNTLYFRYCECVTCKIEKPARSKHCSVCGQCVLLNDHHCIWINNCVGLRNMRWFLAYLVSLSLILVYGFVLDVRFTWENWESFGATSNSSGVSSTSDSSLPSSSNIISSVFWNYLMIYVNCWKLLILAVTGKGASDKVSQRLAILFMIICVVFFAVVFMFFYGILYNYGYMGMSENEKFKWRTIQNFVEYKELYKYYVAGDETSRFSNELKTGPKGEFVYLEKYIYWRTNTPMPEQETVGKYTTWWDVLKSNFVWRSSSKSSESNADLPKFVRYVTLNKYDEKEVVVNSENSGRMELVKSVNELDNVYDKDNFWQNMQILRG